MEQVASSSNLNQAYKRVKANKGAAGVDGMTVGELLAWVKVNREGLIASLIDGTYQPETVRGMELPKPGGGMRQLGIPTVVDRLVQQAICQVLEPMARLARPVGDKRLLRIVRRFLQAGMMQGGVVIERHEGTPQGGPLSPLLGLARAKERLRRLTRRNRGIALERMTGEVNGFTRGWVTYFRHAACKTALLELDEWLRRKLRCVRLKQCKRAKATVDFLVRCGVPVKRAWPLALSGKGWWRKAGSPPAAEVMTLQWFGAQGLVSLAAHYAALRPAGNRRVP